MTDEQKNGSKLKNILAIIAFILLLLVGIWSAVKVISFIPNLFSHTGVQTTTNTQKNITLGQRDIALRITPETVQSGNDVVVDWARKKTKGGNEGVISFSYACTDNFHFEINGTSIPCNAPYTMTPETTALTLIPITNTKQVDAPIAITYTNMNNESVRDTSTLVVTNTNPITTTAPTHTTNTTPAATTDNTKQPIEAPSVVTPSKQVNTVAVPKYQVVRIPRASNPYGVADLMIDHIQVGSITPYGTFEAKNTVSMYSLGAVQFIAHNVGTKESGTWYFSARVPSNGGYTFNSQPQPSLLPGASAQILVTFDQLTQGGQTVFIQVDPYNYVPESNEQNNILSHSMYVLGF